MHTRTCTRIKTYACDLTLVTAATRTFSCHVLCSLLHATFFKRRWHSNTALVSILGNVQHKWQGNILASAYSYETAEHLGTSYRPTACRWSDEPDKDYLRHRLTAVQDDLLAVQNRWLGLLLA